MNKGYNGTKHASRSPSATFESSTKSSRISYTSLLPVSTYYWSINFIFSLSKDETNSSLIFETRKLSWIDILKIGVRWK